MFAINDRGCFPTWAATGTTGIAQTTAAQMGYALGATTPTNIQIAVEWGYVALICSTYGTCCTSNLCNGVEQIVVGSRNIIFLMISMLTAKYFY